MKKYELELWVITEDGRPVLRPASRWVSYEELRDLTARLNRVEELERHLAEVTAEARS